MTPTRWASTATWAERNVTLDGRPFRREEWPQIVDFLDALDTGTGKTLIAMMPPQRGKTLAAQLHLARNVAMRVEQELKYPGEIKVTVIRESRSIEYAR